MDFLRQSFTIKSSVIYAGLFLFSFPALSATDNFSFVDFNIAFVLGLSMPVLLFVVLMKPLVPVKWGFPALTTGCLLGLLYSIENLSSMQVVASLSFAAMFIALLCLWSLYYEHSNSITTANTKFSLSLITTTTILYLLSLWVFPKIDAYIGWLIMSGVILLTQAVRLLLLFKSNAVNIFRFVCQWVLMCCFIGVMYLWLNTKLDVIWLVIASVLVYLISLVNGCWLFAQHIYSTFSVGQEVVKNNNQGDLFTYNHDPATNLPSSQQALRCFEQSLKSSKDKKLAAIVFKPINFQQVNKVLGHHNSDILLLQLAYCLQKKVADNESLLSFDGHPESIRIARLQSLHFLVIYDLSTETHPDETVINAFCQQLASAVPEAMSFKSFSLNFELAFGIAVSGRNGDSVEEIVAYAGDALLHAESNQQMLSYFDGTSALYNEKQLLLMERLKEDIADENLRWYLQPQINISDKSIGGFELKVHWYSGSADPLELHEFIEIAEYSGDVYLLTKKMVNQAFKALFDLHKIGVYQSVTVSLSSKDLLEPDLVDYIELQMSTYHISAKYLMIELTEQVMLSACTRAKSMIDQLRAINIRIAIGSFSGSYESLRYLRKMSIHQVKINCQQLGDSEDNRADKAIVNALINLTRAMKLPLIGTGINNREAKRNFSAMGGVFLQGEVIDRGVVPDEIEIWLKKWFEQYPSAKP